MMSLMNKSADWPRTFCTSFFNEKGWLLTSHQLRYEIWPRQMFFRLSLCTLSFLCVFIYGQFFNPDYKTWSTCKSYSGYLLETLNNKRKSPYSAVFEVKAAAAKHVLFASRISRLWSQEFCKNRMKKTKALKPSTNRYLHQVKKLLKVFNKAIAVIIP